MRSYHRTLSQAASVTDPRTLVTSYGPDGLGNVKTQSSPDSGASSYSYDVKGNVTASVDARGKTTTFSYDSLDRLTAIGYPTGTATTFEWDGGPSKPANVSGITVNRVNANGSGQSATAQNLAGGIAYNVEGTPFTFNCKGCLPTIRL